jgi:ATP phosphoribosyltransferase
VPGRHEDDVASHIISNLDLAGERGPTIAPVVSKDRSETRWFAVSIIVSDRHMLDAVDHLRRAGSTGITVSTPDYMFAAESDAFARLRTAACGCPEE